MHCIRLAEIGVKTGFKYFSFHIALCAGGASRLVCVRYERDDVGQAESSALNDCKMWKAVFEKRCLSACAFCANSHNVNDEPRATRKAFSSYYFYALRYINFVRVCLYTRGNRRACNRARAAHKIELSGVETKEITVIVCERGIIYCRVWPNAKPIASSRNPNAPGCSDWWNGDLAERAICKPLTSFSGH